MVNFTSMNFLRKIILFSAILLATVAIGGSAAHAQTQPEEQQQEAADIQSSACKGADLLFTSDPVGNECTFSGVDAGDKLNSLIKQVVNIFSAVVGVVAVIMIIVGGFRYITSGGDTGNVTTAKNTILYAIIGLVVVVFAQFIVKFVLTRAADIAG